MNRGYERTRRTAALAGVFTLLASLLATVTVLVGASPASAAPGDPFDVTRPTIFVAQSPPGGTTGLYRAESTGDGEYTFSAEGFPLSQGLYNALSFNEADGYLYGITMAATETIPLASLVRIGQGGSVTRVGTNTYVHSGPGHDPNRLRAWFAGAFNPNDGYLYIADSGANNPVMALNVTTGAVARTFSVSPNVGLGQDFEYVGGYFWSMQNNGSVNRLDPQTGAVTTFAGVGPTADGGYGAAWRYGNGNLGFSSNATGDIVQLKITNPASATPSFEVVHVSPGPMSSQNDGTAIPGLPADLEIVKSAPEFHLPGGTITYTLSVTNQGPSESSGWVTKDTLPAGVTNVSTGGAGVCTIDGRDVNCSGGRLGVGETADITITVTAPTAATECLTNVASVYGNEFDPDESNNEDSAVSCARDLAITKTSDADADTRPGDVVNYTVTATNTGAAGFTAADPAVVFDDLTGVLDDAAYNADAVANQAGTLAYSAPHLSWRGALGAGETVELRYSVTIGSNGDGEIRNVAWQPEDPQNPVTPDCTAPVDGRDPTTGEPCAQTVGELPRLTISKTANRTDLPAIGETVMYTVEVTNEGPGDYTAAAPATMTDDLSAVLDDATLVSMTSSTGAVTVSGSTLSWEGPLAAGQTATITYSVTYNAAGDQVLRNQACVPESAVLPGQPNCDFVQIPGAGLTQWKQVQSSATPAVAGTVLTYTLFFKNDGPAAATVDAVDDLTHVTDDATVTVEPSSVGGLSAVRSGDQIAVSGSVPSGETYTVEYKVRINPDGERGDDVAANFLLEPGDTPPADPVCDPTDEAFPECTTTPIAAVTYTKSVAASATPVVAGTVLTYTVTVENTGTAPAPVAREDVLTGVLDDADVTSEPESDTAGVTVTNVTGGRFQIGGQIAVGATATITYQVTVKADADRGDNRADNFLVPPGGTPPATCTTGTECTSTPMPLIESAKASVPASGTAVEAGDEVEYTLTFTNSGDAAGSVDFTDDLSDVLDDADLTDGPTASNAALDAELTGNTMQVTGTLAADQTVTVSYTVTVGADGERTNNRLGNVLAPTGTTDPECGDPGVSCTTNPVPLLDSWKTVSADTSPVSAGTVLTYTLHFENSGEAAATVDAIDDLTHVTDDADVTVEPSSDELTVDRDGDIIEIGGNVPAGQTYTVTYQVTLKADADRGDDLAANYLLEPGQTPPTDPICIPTDLLRPDCTVTPIGRLITSKAVVAQPTPVDVGTVLTYTLTFENEGLAPVVVDHTDLLADVLDDADLTSNPAASNAALTASAVEDDEFTVTGQLAAGQTVTVTYQVTVKDESDRGNNIASNFLVPTGDTPPETCADDNDNCTVTPLPLVEVEKSASPATGTAVQTGDEITFTLNFTNSGEAAGPVDHTDNLTAVLDDADLTSAPVSSDPALTVTDGADGRVRVTGTLAADQTVTVSYTVTVKPDGERGDNRLRNVVAKTSVPDPECGDAGVSCTEHPAGELDDWKTLDPASGSTLRPGDTATYTLHFENIGEGTVDINRDDVLSGVLDDARVTSAPESSDAALSASAIEDGRFTVTGTLQPGQKATVSYTVTVKGDGERGDDRLGNFLVPNGQAPPETCAPTQGQRSDCTVNHVSDVQVTKSSDPESGSKVKPGDEVTYTLTFENRSTNTEAADEEIDYTDHMAGVLDDATLVDGPNTSDDALTAVAKGKKIRITGSVPAGETYTVDYTVEVKAYADQGDHALDNVVAITGEEPVCAPNSQLCTSNAISPRTVGDDPKKLSDTGAPVSGVAVLAALLLLGAGGGLLLYRRRRSH